MIGRYYYPALRTQIIVYPLLSAVFGLLITLGQSTMIDFLAGSSTGVSVVSRPLGMLSTMAVGLAATAMVFMFYFASATFSRQSRDIDVSLPALWSEKAAFVLLYLYVFIPIALYMPMISIRMLGEMLTSTDFAVVMDGAYLSVGSQSFGPSSLDSYLPMSVCAFIVLSRPKPSFGRAAGFTILTLVAMGLISIVITLLWVLPLSDAALETLKQTEGVSKLNDTINLTTVQYIETGISVAASLIFLLLTIRSFKKIQL